jgi:hypothetical protein
VVSAAAARTNPQLGGYPDEVARPIPGDELVDDAEMVATRAITIDPPPSAIWPWLVQMGVGRGGAYTYDWIERLLGLEMHSAEKIVPSSSTSRSVTCCRCARTTPGCGSRSWIPSGRFRRARRNGAWVWSFALVPDNGSTRLISRNRARVRTLGERAGMAAMEVGSLVMERKMLYGIKQRAEQGGAVDTRAPSNHK